MSSSMATGSAVESSTVSSKPLMTEAASGQSSSVDVPKQLSAGDTQLSAPGTVTRDSLQDSVDAITNLSISHEPVKDADADNLRQNEMKDCLEFTQLHIEKGLRDHDLLQKARANEARFMELVQEYHSELEEFDMLKVSAASADLNRYLEENRVQLLEHRIQLEEYWNRRMKEHVHRMREHDRRVKEHNLRVEEQDLAMEHVLQYNRYVEVHDHFVQEHARKLEEYGVLFVQQDIFRQKIKNYQDLRFLEEIEHLRKAFDDAAAEDYGHTSELQDTGEALNEDRSSNGEGMV